MYNRRGDEQFCVLLYVPIKNADDAETKKNVVDCCCCSNILF